jgi:hypothetical protein
MEPLWSPVVPIGGNQRQMGLTRKRRKQAKTVAVGCDRLRKEALVRRGRRFESVRGLLAFRCSGRGCVLCVGDSAFVQRPRSVHRVDVGPAAGEQVEQPDRVLAAISREVAVVAVHYPVKCSDRGGHASSHSPVAGWRMNWRTETKHPANHVLSIGLQNRRNRCNPSVGRFDSYAAPLGNNLHIRTSVATCVFSRKSMRNSLRAAAAA